MIKRFSIQVIFRIFLLLITCLLFAWFVRLSFWFTVLGFGVLVVVQVWSLYQYVNAVNYTLVKFLDALKSNDHSVYFSPSLKGKSFARVFEDFNLVIDLFRKNKIEKEAQFKHFKQILEQVNLGIISIQEKDLMSDESNEEILFINRAVSDILGIPQHKYWYRIARQAPWFANEVKKIRSGGKKLTEIGTDAEKKQLSIEVVPITLLHIPYLIITFQDIQAEIEQKEIEAWHNVIRVMAHEMLNSFTPISSLAGTIKSMTENSSGNLLDESGMDIEIIKDINLAAGTIKRRSEGLLDFVEDYRKLANLPKPQFRRVNIKEFLLNIERLMKPGLDNHGVDFQIGAVPSNATVMMDSKLIEQIFINLIGNSVFALEHTTNPRIMIGCRIGDGHIVLSHSDNGRGIQPEILSQIFIPFFTTRKSGSGIGLSLSKDIMKQHGGQLFVNSEPHIETTFSLVFAN